jgi:hypothetical protein
MKELAFILSERVDRLLDAEPGISASSGGSV